MDVDVDDGPAEAHTVFWKRFADILHNLDEVYYCHDYAPVIEAAPQGVELKPSSSSQPLIIEPPTGFRNPGVLCYFNALLQALRYSKQLNAFVARIDLDRGLDEVVMAFVNAIKDREGPIANGANQRLLDVLSAEMSRVSVTWDNKQQDASEFFHSVLMRALEREFVNRTSGNPLTYTKSTRISDSVWQTLTYFPKLLHDANMVKEFTTVNTEMTMPGMPAMTHCLFGTHVLEIATCANCGKRLKSGLVGEFLTRVYDDSVSSAFDQKVESNTRDEPVCDSCMYTQRMCTYTVLRTPPILAFFVPGFSENPTAENPAVNVDKLWKTLPIHLSVRDAYKNADVQYTLCGACAYFPFDGKGKSGHYKAYVCHENQWYEINDGDVQPWRNIRDGRTIELGNGSKGFSVAFYDRVDP